MPLQLRLQSFLTIFFLSYKIVKKDSRTQGIPFIMLTVEAIQKTMNKAIALGVDSYIVKPVTEDIFIKEMLRVIKDKSNI